MENKQEEKVKLCRPGNDEEFKQGKVEKDLMSFYVIFKCPKSAAYALFYPHLADKNGRLNEAGRRECRMFFSHPKNEEYMAALEAHLKSLMKGARISTASSELSDERIDKAYQSFLKQTIEDIENGKEMDNDTKKLFMELFKKLGRFKDDVEQEIKPLRFLPARCGECRYRIGVESAVLDGEILDMCAYCKARKCAEEHGYRFNEGKDLLEIPKEIVAELESKNNVRLEDILNGQIEN